MPTEPDILELHVDGRAYRLAPVGWELCFEAAEQVCRHRDQRLERALACCRNLDGEQFDSAVSLAFERHQRIVGNQEIADWLDSPDGGLFTFARALEKHHPEMTEGDAQRVYRLLTAGQLREIARFLSERFPPLADPSSRQPHSEDIST